MTRSQGSDSQPRTLSSPPSTVEPSSAAPPTEANDDPKTPHPCSRSASLGAAVFASEISEQPDLRESGADRAHRWFRLDHRAYSARSPSRAQLRASNPDPPERP